jgi:hypothetical protein
MRVISSKKLIDGHYRIGYCYFKAQRLFVKTLRFND